jgi:hypothetical protein
MSATPSSVLRTQAHTHRLGAQRPWADGILIETYVVGDINGNRLVNNFDIMPFMHVLGPGPVTR